MIWIKVVISAFILLEAGNIIMLYFFPDSKLANSVGVFQAWEKTKLDSGTHDFAKYMVNWVAGTKIIVILLLILLMFSADQKMLIQAAGVMVIAISTFYWRLFPLARKMDREGQIDPAGYSSTLGWMILGMIVVFGAAAILAFIA